MATQTGILGIKGTVGGLVFAKDGSIRQKPASNKAAFNSKASLQRTRENAAEFGLAAQDAKLIRQALRSQIAAATDRLMVSRLTQAVRDIIGLDSVHDRGQRQTMADNCGGLQGFNFNKGANLGQSFFAPYSVEANGANVSLVIPTLNPQTDVSAPQGSTHYELVYGAVAVNFATKTYTVGTVATPLAAQVLLAAAQSNVSIVATLPAAPTANELVIAVVGINYYQQLNGKMYPLNNNASNPLSIEYVSATMASGGGSATVYNTSLAGPNGSAQGITLAASAGDTLQFDALASGGSAPASMDVSVGGAQVASVAYLDRYNGKSFRLTHLGVAHSGTFAATVTF